MSSLKALRLAAMVAVCSWDSQAGALKRDCTTILSAVERLACFDQEAGTPPLPASTPAATAPVPGAEPTQAAFRDLDHIAQLVAHNEAARTSGERGFLIARAEDRLPGQSRIVMSAPPLGRNPAWPVLVISCLSNISRLQLLADAPLDRHRMTIRLVLDNRALGGARPWQVLEDGVVVDAGRGLVAIELLRQLTAPGAALKVESDYRPFDGLTFDALALAALMKEQRQACHW